MSEHSTQVTMAPGSDQWRRTMTASKIPAMLGLSPWESPRSLWHMMHGDIDPDAGNDYTRRGHYLEPAILDWWVDQHVGAVTDWGTQPTFHLGDWAAATPDAVCDLTEGGADRPVLVEAKSTAQEWDQLPAYYLAQVIWQMHVSGIGRCHVPTLGPRLRFTEYVVDYADYAEDAQLIEAQAHAFYDSLTNDEPPPLDDTVATYDAVRKLHPDIDPGVEVELDGRLALSLTFAVEQAKYWERTARGHRSSVLEAMGRAQYASYNDVLVARRQAHGDDIRLVVTGKSTYITSTQQEPA